MKKLIWYLVVLGVTIAVSLSGCGDSDTTTTTEAEKADKTTTTEATEKSAIDFPQEGKDIRWIVPFSPGGGFDTYARTVSRFLPKYLPNEPNVIVENIPGGGSVTGTRELTMSDPDGYTVGLAAYPGIWMAAITEDIGFDPADLTNVAILGMDPQAVFVAADSPIDTVEDLRNTAIKFGTTSRGASMYAFCAI